MYGPTQNRWAPETVKPLVSAYRLRAGAQSRPRGRAGGGRGWVLMQVPVVACLLGKGREESNGERPSGGGIDATW